MSSVAVLPETVHTFGVAEAKATDNPEVALAINATGVPTVCDGITPKVIVCGLKLTAKLCETGVAAA